jgi:hypothetical protein
VEYLSGGRENQIIRSGNVVHRPTGPYTTAVHGLLNHLHQVGFTGAPRPLGFDQNGREILTFLPGQVSNYPLTKNAASPEALTSAAGLLRAYHDAATSYIRKMPSDQTWMLPTRDPVEVICHGDYAPYNVVLNGRQAIAIIDFDTAHPGPIEWDIAYALYRWSPLKNPTNPDSLGELQTQIERARQFCGAYDLPRLRRQNLVSIMVERLQNMINFIQSQAKQGNPTFQAHLAAGHHLSYQKDIIYLQQNETQIQTGLILPDSTYRP